MIKKDFVFGDFIVNESSRPLIICDIGINHEGDLELAKEIVLSAKNAGADVIKHQTHVIDDEMSKEAKKVIPGNSSDSIYSIMERCALSYDDELQLKEFVEANGMMFLSTPFSRAAADQFERMNVQAYKIGSGECNNIPLLRHVASFGKPMIVSTGMNDMNSVKRTVEVLNEYTIQFALLHCTNLYPTPPNLVRLGAMVEMMKEFPEVYVGLSDHTVNNTACIAATTLGARILERHFIDYKFRPGPDIINSMTPLELFDLRTKTDEIMEMLGGNKDAIPEEQVTRDFAFATVVTISEINENDIFNKDNIWVKRPGTGEIPASDFEKILGKRATKKLDNDVHLKLEDVE